jgi:hypothetical protein
MTALLTRKQIQRDYIRVDILIESVLGIFGPHAIARGSLQPFGIGSNLI